MAGGMPREQRTKRMITSQDRIRSGGYEFSFCRPLVTAAGFAAALFAMQTLSAEAQGNQPQRQGQSPAQQQQAQPEELEVEQIALTRSQIDAFIATEKEIAPVTAKLKGNAQPSKQMMAQMESIAKKNGFKDFDEYGDVGANIGMVYGGINPENKRFEPEELIKRQIAAVNADQKIPPAQKKRILQNLQQASSSMPKLKYPANADLIAANYDRLKAVMEGGQQQPQQAAPQQQRQQPRRQ
jgi:hypothetical protein